MPITKATGYRDSNGVIHATAEEAQKAELSSLLKPILGRVWDLQTAGGVDNGVQYLSSLADELLNASDILITILTTGPRSRPTSRKRAGTTNPKRATRAQA